MALTTLAFVYLCAVFLSILLIICAAHHIICFNEMNTNCVNPIKYCQSLNPLGKYLYVMFTGKKGMKFHRS